MDVSVGSFTSTRYSNSFSAIHSRPSVETSVQKNGILRGIHWLEQGRYGVSELRSWKTLGLQDRRILKVNCGEFGLNSADFSTVRVRALSDENSGDDEKKSSENGYALLPEPGVSSQVMNSSKELASRGKDDEISSVVNTLMGSPSGGSRTGLFRTPISGGVQSATSAHGLPRPALAVRNLMEQARFAHLCTVMSRMHHRRKGYPFGSLVDFAPDSMGPRQQCLIMQKQLLRKEWAHGHYTAKHQQGASQQWGNFYYYRMELISDVYFIGGFGTVAWVDVHEYENVQPDKIAVNGGEQNLKELNAMFSKPLRELLSTETEVDDAALISIDSKGTDIRVRQGAQFNVQRLSFQMGHEVETLEEAKIALHKLVDKCKKLSKKV